MNRRQAAGFRLSTTLPRGEGYCAPDAVARSVLAGLARPRALLEPGSGASGAGAGPRVLVVGGGFGGMMATRLLAHAEVEVTLLDRNTTTLFAPLLYQCATGILSEGEITRPLREVFERSRNVTVLLGDAVTVDASARQLTAARARRVDVRAGVRLLDPGRRDAPVLLRSRRVRRVGAGDEVDRRCARGATPDLQRVRVRRDAAARSMRAVADVRGRRRGSDRGRARGPDPRAGHAHDRQGVSPHRSEPRRVCCCSTGSTGR